MIVRVNSSGWASRSILTSAQMNAVDTNVTNALDKRSGFTDTLASQITITGSITANTAPSNPLILGIATQTSNVNTNNILIEAQAPFAGATSSAKNAGNIVFDLPPPIAGGTYGSVEFLQGLNTFLNITNAGGSNPTISTTSPLTIEATNFSNMLVFAAGTMTLSGSDVVLHNSNVGLNIGLTSNTIDFTGGVGNSDTPIFSINTTNGGFALSYPTTTSNGAVTNIAGQTSTSATGGAVNITAGTGTVSRGGNLTIEGGSTTGNGTTAGSAFVIGGSAAFGSGDGDGGHVFIGGGAPNGTGYTGNISLGNVDSVNWQGGSGIVYLAIDQYAPSGAPVGGMFMYTDGVNLFVQFPGGSVKTVTVS